MILMKNGNIKICLLGIVGLLCSSPTTAQRLDERAYQRSSIIMMMIEHPMYLYQQELTDVFKAMSCPDRFNDHSLGVKSVKFATQEFSDQQDAIASFIKQVKLGNRAVAKWFNWDKATGTFNMELVKSRGLYNATEFDKQLAQHTVRGMAMLEDAGENLISDTYLIMNDICYAGTYSNREADFHSVRKNTFKVNVRSYIYQLEWNDSILYDFYYKYNQHNLNFIKESNYTFHYKADVETTYEETSKAISLQDLIRRVVVRSLDVNIAKLQKTYPRFRIKAPLISTEPLRAYIGKKEGITEDSVFEVLETIENEDGSHRYERVGLIAPISGHIWDNRYMADDEGTQDSKLGYTTFRVIKGDGFYHGMLIRETTTP